MATLEEVYKAVLALCPNAIVDEEDDGNIVIVTMQHLADDKKTLVDFEDETEEDA